MSLPVVDKRTLSSCPSPCCVVLQSLLSYYKSVKLNFNLQIRVYRVNYYVFSLFSVSVVQYSDCWLSLFYCNCNADCRRYKSSTSLRQVRFRPVKQFHWYQTDDTVAQQFKTFVAASLEKINPKYPKYKFQKNATTVLNVVVAFVPHRKFPLSTSVYSQ